MFRKGSRAFRQGHSTTDHFFKPCQEAAMARNNKEVFMAAFVDFEGAFNSVWHDGLRFKLEKRKELRGETTRWISSFLNDRDYSVKVDNYLSASAHKARLSVPFFLAFSQLTCPFLSA